SRPPTMPRFLWYAHQNDSTPLAGIVTVASTLPWLSMLLFTCCASTVTLCAVPVALTRCRVSFWPGVPLSTDGWKKKLSALIVAVDLPVTSAVPWLFACRPPMVGGLPAPDDPLPSHALHDRSVQARVDRAGRDRREWPALPAQHPAPQRLRLRAEHVVRQAIDDV